MSWTLALPPSRMPSNHDERLRPSWRSSGHAPLPPSKEMDTPSPRRRWS